MNVMKFRNSFRKFWHKAIPMIGIGALLLGNQVSDYTPLHAQSQPTPLVVTEESACLQAAALLAGGAGPRVLSRPLHQQQDWVKFTVQKGKRYQLAVSQAEQAVPLLLQAGCQTSSQMYAANNGKLLFTAQTDATYYVKLGAPATVTAAANGYQVTMAEVSAAPPSKLALNLVPIEIYRRAFDRLEELRGSPDMPEWQAAQFNNEVRLLYRPDIEGVAYYEFSVEKPGPNGSEPAGFIEVAAGPFDHPIPSWSPAGLSPTQALANLAPTSGDTISQFFKVDEVAYAAEYEQSSPLGLAFAATEPLLLGDLPPKFSGFDALPLDFEPSTTDYVWQPATTGGADSETAVMTPTLAITGPDEPFTLSQEPWDSWAALKSEYAEANGLLLDQLELDASADWNYLQQVDQFGEPLLKGESRTIRALSTITVTAISVSGEGSGPAFLQQEAITEGGQQTGVRLTVTGEPGETYRELPLTVTLQYSSGISETKRFAIINQSSLRAPNQLYLPLVSNGGPQPQVTAAHTAGTAQVDAATIINYGPWTTWWAAGTWEGNSWPFYNQIPPNTRVNSKPCHSGCTNTAYAMLFGWADRRAATPGSIWNGRWGIYRQNGGNGGDAIAPLWESEDRGIENVMMELNRYMGTFCQGNGGATYISRQPDAQKYLTPRTGATIRVREANGWWIFGTNEDDTRNQTINAIKGGSPVVITTPGHSPLAHGYREASQRVRRCFIFCWYTTEYLREFYINQGWGNAGNKWIPAKTISSGEILRN